MRLFQGFLAGVMSAFLVTSLLRKTKKTKQQEQQQQQHKKARDSLDPMSIKNYASDSK